MNYQWKCGARIRADANVAGAMCDALAAEGRLTAKNLLDANRAEDAPLHDAFEWNDSVAAEAYREDQARHIIACIVTVPAETKQPTRAFFTVARDESEYKPLETILKSADDSARLLQTIRRELNAIRTKYSTVAEFAGVWRAIDELGVQP